MEAGSEALKARVVEAEAVAVCRVAWAEAHAALSRRVREVPGDAPVIEQAKAALAQDWPRFLVQAHRWGRCAHQQSIYRSGKRRCHREPGHAHQPAYVLALAERRHRALRPGHLR